MGRTARLMPGKTTILLTKGTLDEIFHYASKAKEKRMYRSIESIKNDLDNGIPLETKEDKNKSNSRGDASQKPLGIVDKEKQEKLF